MVAAFVLIVGILGVLKMLDTANATSIVSQTRAQANSLTRQIVEAARGVNYGLLTNQAAVESLLKAQPGLQDSDPSDSAWTIVRKSTTYSVTVFALCTVDDGLDKYGSHAAAAPSFCPDSATTGTEDSNPDDYKRLTVQLAWTDPAGVRRTVRQTTLITNPGSGAGPAIYPSFQMTLPACGTVVANPGTSPPGDCRITETSPETDQATFRLFTKDPAATVRWSVDDAPKGAATPNCAAGATSCSDFSFTWNLGTVASGSTVDGSYLIGAQAVDETGNAGTPVYLSVTVNRRAPDVTPSLNVGWNGSIVEIEWRANVDRDVERYEVWRVDASGNPDPAPGSGNDDLVCDPVTPLTASARTCSDSTATAGTSPRYWIVAYDRNDSGVLRAGTVSPVATADPTNVPPNPPSNFVCTTSCSNGGQAVSFSWTDNGDTAPGSIAFFRIYRRTTPGTPTRADRYDRTNGPTPTTYTDTDTSTSRYYWITAVDNNLAESAPVPLSGSGAAGG
jgi:hypothetical protein